MVKRRTLEVYRRYNKFHIFMLNFIIAMTLYGKDWKKVEMHIGSRSGAQIRSHAQKFFNRIEKEMGTDIDTFLHQKAESLKNKGGTLNSSLLENDESY